MDTVHPGVAALAASASPLAPGAPNPEDSSLEIPVVPVSVSTFAPPLPAIEVSMMPTVGGAPSAFSAWRDVGNGQQPLNTATSGVFGDTRDTFFDSAASGASDSDDSEMDDAESLSSGRRMSVSTAGFRSHNSMITEARRQSHRPQPYVIPGSRGGGESNQLDSVSFSGSPYRGNGIVLGSPGRWAGPTPSVSMSGPGYPGQWNRMHVVPLTTGASLGGNSGSGAYNSGSLDSPSSAARRSYSFSGDVAMDMNGRRERSVSAGPVDMPIVAAGLSQGSLPAANASLGSQAGPPHTPSHSRSKSLSHSQAPPLHDHPALPIFPEISTAATPHARKNRISALLHEDAPDHEIEHERGVTWLLKRQLGKLGVSPTTDLPPHTPVRRASDAGITRREFVPLAPPTSDPSLDSHDDVEDRLASAAPSETFASHEEDETASLLSVSMSQEPLTPRSEREMELNGSTGFRSIPRRRESFMVDEEEMLEGMLGGYQSGAFSVRMSPIPNSQLKMPVNYVSKTSKLNPENSYYRQQTPIFSVPLPIDEVPLSPSLMPNPHFARVMEPSSGKRKRAASEVAEETPPVTGTPGSKRFEPYAKRHHRSYSGSFDRVPGSPSSANAAMMMMLSSPVAQQHAKMPMPPGDELPPPSSAGSSSAILHSPRLIPQVTTYSGGVGAMLNLTEAQELASRWSIGGGAPVGSASAGNGSQSSGSQNSRRMEE